VALAAASTCTDTPFLFGYQWPSSRPSSRRVPYARAVGAVRWLAARAGLAAVCGQGRYGVSAPRSGFCAHIAGGWRSPLCRRRVSPRSPWLRDRDRVAARVRTAPPPRPAASRACTGAAGAAPRRRPPPPLVLLAFGPAIAVVLLLIYWVGAGPNLFCTSPLRSRPRAGWLLRSPECAVVSRRPPRAAASASFVPLRVANLSRAAHGASRAAGGLRHRHSWCCAVGDPACRY